MRIGVISPHPPAFPGGGSPGRLYFLLRELAQRHSVKLLSGECWGGITAETVLSPLGIEARRVVPPAWVPQGGPWARRLRRWRRLWCGPPADVRDVCRIRRQVEAGVSEWMREQAVDALYVHHSMGYALIERIPVQVPVVVDLHNVMCHYYWRSLRLARWSRKTLPFALQAWKMWNFERRLFRHPDLRFLTCSEQDAAVLRGLSPAARVEVVPNGVDCSYFSALPATGDPNRLLFLGTMSYLPNQDAVHYLVREILPLVRAGCPDATLTVVGMDPPEDIRALDDGRTVSVLGSVPDVRPYAVGSAIHLVPLRLGSGTRLKILEALALGRAVVSSHLGAEGLPFLDGEHLMLADSPEEFARKTLTLMREPALREQLAQRGQQAVRERFDWQVIGKDLERAFRSSSPTDH